MSFICFSLPVRQFVITTVNFCKVVNGVRIWQFWSLIFFSLPFALPERQMFLLSYTNNATHELTLMVQPARS